MPAKLAHLAEGRFSLTGGDVTKKLVFFGRLVHDAQSNPHHNNEFIAS